MVVVVSGVLFYVEFAAQIYSLSLSILEDAVGFFFFPSRSKHQ
jgi:hypothetical protein